MEAQTPRIGVYRIAHWTALLTDAGANAREHLITTIALREIVGCFTR